VTPTLVYATHYPFLNVALITSIVLTVGLTLAVIPYGKRRPVGTPVSWGEAVFAATYVFAVLFLAYGVVPHQWLTHADNELTWRADQIFVGHSAGAQLHLAWMPFDVTKQTVRDIVVVVIYAVFLGLQILMWSWWQNRDKAKPVPELPTSTYGRPLVRKG
jgi:hypothetical protein